MNETSSTRIGPMLRRPAAPVNRPRASASILLPPPPAPHPLTPALRQLAGMDRLLIYDVPPQERPFRLRPGSATVRGGASWWRYVAERRRLDTGLLTLVVTLRPLAPDERLLAIDWGTRFANAFLLVEPQATASASLEAGGGLNLAFAPTRLREAFGVWRYWRRGPHNRLVGLAQELDLRTHATLAECLKTVVPATFPASALRASFYTLNQDESDLFALRYVEQIAVPYLTRLGLPVLYDFALLLNAMRDLVNDGHAWVEDRATRLQYHGPERPLPPTLPDEALRRLIRI